MSDQEFFENWADDIGGHARRARVAVYFWKFLSFLPVPVGMASWTIGAYGLSAADADQHSTGMPSRNASDVALLVVGGVSVFLERLKPRKYLVTAKQHRSTLEQTESYLRLQLSLPADRRLPPEELHLKIVSMLDNRQTTALLRSPAALDGRIRV